MTGSEIYERTFVAAKRPHSSVTGAEAAFDWKGSGAPIEKARARRVRWKTPEIALPALQTNSLVWQVAAAPHEMQVRIGNKFFNLHGAESETAVVPPGMESEWSGPNRMFGEILQLELNPQFVERTIENSLLPAIDMWHQPQITTTNERVRQIALILAGFGSESEGFGKLYEDSLAVALIACLFGKQSSSGELNAPRASEQSRGLPKYKLRRAVEYIDANLTEDIALDDLAGLTRMSVFYFVRLFKQSTGLSPHQYVLRERVERAKKLLAGEQHSITEIALEVGCSSHSHFSTVFRRVTGETPKTYRASRLAQC